MSILKLLTKSKVIDLNPKMKMKSKGEVLLTNVPDFLAEFGGMKGYQLSRTSVPGNKLQEGATGTSQLDDNSVTNVKMADNAVGNAEMLNDAIKQAELDTEEVSLTVSSGNPSGTATVTSGARVSTVRPTAQDQIIKSVVVSGTTLTITLLNNATADNVFVVTLLKS